MSRRVIVLTPRGRRSIPIYSEEELNKTGETHIMIASQTSIPTTSSLTENDLIFKNGSLQGAIKDTLYYSILSSNILLTTDTFFGGEEITIVPWK
jgi:hypothetical protein